MSSASHSAACSGVRGAALKGRRKQRQRDLGVPQEFDIQLGVLFAGMLAPQSARVNHVERHRRNGTWQVRRGGAALDVLADPRDPPHLQIARALDPGLVARCRPGELGKGARDKAHIERLCPAPASHCIVADDDQTNLPRPARRPVGARPLRAVEAGCLRDPPAESGGALGEPTRMGRPGTAGEDHLGVHVGAVGELTDGRRLLRADGEDVSLVQPWHLERIDHPLSPRPLGSHRQRPMATLAGMGTHGPRSEPTRQDQGVQATRVLDDRAVGAVGPDHHDVPASGVTIMRIEHEVDRHLLGRHGRPRGCSILRPPVRTRTQW